MDLSIIIVNWNSTDYLRACLASVYRYTRGIAFEIIVIDNASTDNCEQVILREFPEVIFISSTDNLGFACANNRAVVRSSGELLLFLNPDTEIAGNVLAEMVRHLRAHPKAGAAGVRLLNSDGSVQLSCIQAFPTLINQVLDSDFLRRRMPRSRLWGMQALFSGSQSHSDVEAISGACFMIRREVFEAVGHFTEAYFMYVEDLELSYRVKHAGHAIHYLGACEVVHHGGKSSAQREDYFASLRQR